MDWRNVIPVALKRAASAAHKYTARNAGRKSNNQMKEAVRHAPTKPPQPEINLRTE
jgi:hypothetical protein